MSKTTLSPLDYLAVEDELVTKRDKLKDKIVDTLYIMTETNDLETISKAKNELDGLYKQLEDVETKLNDTRTSLRRCILRLFE